MLDLLVLGEIPGTRFQISYQAILLVICVLLSIYGLIHNRRHRHVNRHTDQISYDLIAL